MVAEGWGGGTERAGSYLRPAGMPDLGPNCSMPTQWRAIPNLPSGLVWNAEALCDPSAYTKRGPPHPALLMTHLASREKFHQFFITSAFKTIENIF